MRFFTKEWLSGELTDEAFEAAPLEYRLHLATLQLPHEVSALAGVDIHDSQLLEMKYEAQSAKFMLRLRCGDLQRGYCDVIIDYSDASLDDASLSILNEAIRNPKAEFLYDEVERGVDHFEHSFILTSHMEVCVRFGEVIVRSHAVADREAIVAKVRLASKPLSEST